MNQPHESLKSKSRILNPKSMEGEYACIAIHDEEYGIRTSQVRSVVNTPVIRRVPKAPSFVEGVANISGRIIPLLNPLERLGIRHRTLEDAEQLPVLSRVVLIQLDRSLYGLMVHGISSITYLTEKMIEPVNPLMVEKETPFMQGMAKHGEKLIYLLDAEAFITAGMEMDREDRDAYEAFAAQIGESLEKHAEKKSRRFLTLSIGDEDCGVELIGLKEVIPAESVRGSSGGPDYFAGVVKTKAGILPVLDLQKKLELDPMPYTQDSRVVVIDAGEYDYGILANSVTGFVDISEEEIKGPPAAVSGAGSDHMKGVGMLDAGERLVLLLHEGRILKGKEVKELAKMDDIKMYRQDMKERRRKEVVDFTFVLFTVANMEFAFDLEGLAEIVQFKEATRIPKAPAFIRGMVSVGGELITVIDLRKRFDLGEKGDQSETRIIVLKKGDVAYGVVADFVSEIKGVSRKDVVLPPKIVKGIDSRFIQGMIRIKGTDRTPIVLNIEEILTGAEKAKKPTKASPRRSPRTRKKGK